MLRAEDLEELKEKAQIGFQTLALVFLGWIANSMSDLGNEVRDLNQKMVEVVVRTGNHEKEISGLRLRFENEKLNQQQLRTRI